MFISLETWNGSRLANLNQIETIEPQGAPDADGNITCKIFFASGREIEVLVHESEAVQVNPLIQLVEIKKHVEQQQGQPEQNSQPEPQPEQQPEQQTVS